MLLEALIDNGGRIGVCPPCAKTAGIGDEGLIANAEWMGDSRCSAPQCSLWFSLIDGNKRAKLWLSLRSNRGKQRPGNRNSRAFSL